MQNKIFVYFYLIMAPLFINAEQDIQPEKRKILTINKENSEFEKNPNISSEAKNSIRPYLLPSKHKIKKVLDSIFKNNRATRDIKSFQRAGFFILDERPRSFIHIAKHHKMPGFLLKTYLDTTLEEKHHKASWEWLVRRCEGAKKIRKIIKREKIRHFEVAKKWIYCFPIEPSPPMDSIHTRHPALLIVTDMKLVSSKSNEYAWTHYITKEHLEELYSIISQAKGSSYRADNIAYTKNKTFAFIDTEYPTHGPDFRRIRPYLNSEMQAYWDYLIKKGLNQPSN